MQVQLTAAEDQEQAKQEVRQEVKYSLDELARWGAQQMIALALEAEVADYLERHRHEKDEEGHALVVGNGSARPRKVIVGTAPVEVKAPRVHDRREGEAFQSAILPPYQRKSRRLEEALPTLYLRGLSTGDFAPALSELLGEAAKGFSPSTIVRLKEKWEAEYQVWKERDLSPCDYVYLFADGVNFSIRLEEDRLTCLVVVGVKSDGTKEVVALEDGYRESTESWLFLLRDLKQRGMASPALCVGDGALGFWAALSEVYPESRMQRCWVHKIRNVLDKLPDRLQETAKTHLHRMMSAPDRKTAEEEIERFGTEFGEKYPKAVSCLNEDQEELLTFFDFPEEHWVHLRTTNPIESVFAPVKARTKQTKGAGSRKAGLAMAFKLITTSQDRWRRVNAPHLMPLVRQGVPFKDGQIAFSETKIAA